MFSFKGFEDKEKLISAIRSKAINDGTLLTMAAKKVQNTSQYLVIFCYQHASKLRIHKKETLSNELEFTTGKPQAEGTTIMHAHDVSSHINRSCCAVYKRTNSHNDPNIQSKKRNKTQSKKCGCTFTFSILYDYNSELRFLKKRRISSNSII